MNEIKNRCPKCDSTIEHENFDCQVRTIVDNDSLPIEKQKYMGFEFVVIVKCFKCNTLFEKIATHKDFEIFKMK